MAATGLLNRVLREERRPIVALAVAFALNLALYGLAVRPMSQRVTDADARAAAAEQSRRAAAAEFSSVRAVAAGKDQAERELKVFYEQVLPASLSDAQRATYVSLAQLARETNLRLSNRLASAEPAARASLDRLAISIALEGDYQDIRQFIYRVETGAPFLVIYDLRLDGGASGETLRLSLNLSTYYQAAGNGS